MNISEMQIIRKLKRLAKTLLHYTIFFPHEAYCSMRMDKEGAIVTCTMCGVEHKLGTDNGSTWYVTVL